MLFHIKQTHAPKDCPYGNGGFRSLFDAEAPGITVRGTWLSFPTHTTYFVVEADSPAALQRFVAPGAKAAVCEITPVSEQAAPYPSR